MSDLVRTPNCWFSHVKAQMLMHWSEESMVADRGSGTVSGFEAICRWSLLSIAIHKIFKDDHY